jgi:TonB family protein
VLALLYHGVVLILLEVTGALEHFTPTTLQLVQSTDAVRDNEPEQPMEIDSLVESLQHPPELTDSEKKQKQEEERKDQRGQVVDIAKPAIEQRPDEARFLAEYDSKVAHETKGPVGKDLAGAPKPATPPPQPIAPQPPIPPSSGGPQSSALSMRGPLGTKLPGPSAEPTDVKALGPDGDLAHQAGSGPVRPPDVAGGGALPNHGQLPNLVPSPQALAHALGMGSGSPDYLEDLEDSDSTGLNSKKWKFAAFFNRVKRAVSEEWHPDELLSRHDPSGNIYGAKDRMTMIKVQLQPDGRVADVKVVRTSGVDFLDDEAMSAFKRAQPFDNPPPGLVDSDGYIRFNFGFIVQLSGRTSFKFYKYHD